MPSIIVSLGVEGRQRLNLSLDGVRVKKIVDHFDKLSGSQGSRFTLTNSSIELPATKELEQLVGFANQGDARCVWAELGCTIFYKGISYFDGIAILSGSTRVRRPSSYDLTLIGNGDEFWQRVSRLNMHDLDLGSVFVDRVAIQDSWARNWADDGFAHIFAPILYGKPRGFIDPNVEDPQPAFIDKDFRPSIYYPAILQAVQEATGYTISGELFDLDIFRDRTYVCTRAASQIRRVQAIVCAFSLFKIADESYANGDVLDFDSSVVQCPYLTYNANLDTFTATEDQIIRFNLQMEGQFLDEILVTINGSTVEPKFVSQNGSYISQEIEVSMLNGDELQFVIAGPIPTGGSTVFQANLTGGQVFEPDNILNKFVDLATCLHPHSVKEWINAITHEYCLVWDIDTITRRATARPRFDYKVEGVVYPGFYRYNPIDEVRLDQSNVQQKGENYFGSSLSIAYKQDGQYLFSLLEAAAPDGVPVFGVRFDIPNSTRSGKSELNPLFNVLPTFQLRNFTELPAILASEYDQDSEDLPETWNSEGPITSAMVYRDNATIFYDEGTESPIQYTVPLLAQTLPDLGRINGTPQKPYNSGYNDSQGLDGHVTIFYRQYLAIINCPEILQGVSRINAFEFQADRLNNLRSVRIGANMSTWIPVSIGNFEPIDGTCSRSLIKFLPVTQVVVDQINHY